MRHTLPILFAVLCPLVFACDGDETGADDPTDQFDARDDQSINDWLARPLKSCAISAVLPHRADLSDTGGPEILGWDRSLVLEGADANGIRTFDDDGYTFAGFGEFAPVDPGAVRSGVSGPRSAAAIALTLRDSVCQLTVNGRALFSESLYGTMDVQIAAWPDKGWSDGGNVGVSPDRIPSLNDGYQWHTKYPPLYDFGSSTQGTQTVDHVALWLGVSYADLADHLRFKVANRPDLLQLNGVEFPYIALGDGQHTIVTDAEAQAYSRLDSPSFTWHYSRPGHADQSVDSRIELGTGHVRYAGATRRDTPAAAALAARCVTRIVSRHLAAVPLDSMRHKNGLSTTMFEPCARLTVDLAQAGADDTSVVDLIAYLYSDQARVQYQVGEQYPTYYVPAGLAGIFAAAIVAKSPTALNGDSSILLQHGLESWRNLLAAGAFTTHPELQVAAAEACLARSAWDFNNFEWSPLRVISADEAASIAAALNSLVGPIDDDVLADIKWRIGRSGEPGDVTSLE